MKTMRVSVFFLFIALIAAYASAQKTDSAAKSDQWQSETSKAGSKSEFTPAGNDAATNSPPDAVANTASRVQEKEIFYKLYEDVREKLLSEVKLVLLLLSAAIVVATIGGFYTLKDVINNKIDQSIRDREQRFQKLESDTVTQINHTRVNIGMLEKELQNLTNETQRVFSAKIAALDQQLEEVKRKILESISLRKAMVIADQKVEKTTNSPEEKVFLKMMKRLKELHVNDPDVLLFIGVMENNLDLVKEAMELGGNPHASQGELIERHKSLLHSEFPGIIK